MDTGRKNSAVPFHFLYFFVWFIVKKLKAKLRHDTTSKTKVTGKEFSLKHPTIILSVIRKNINRETTRLRHGRLCSKGGREKTSVYGEGYIRKGKWLYEYA
jgi:hypothetical protein